MADLFFPVQLTGPTTEVVYSSGPVPNVAGVEVSIVRADGILTPPALRVVATGRGRLNIIWSNYTNGASLGVEVGITLNAAPVEGSVSVSAVETQRFMGTVQFDNSPRFDELAVTDAQGTARKLRPYIAILDYAPAIGGSMAVSQETWNTAVAAAIADGCRRVHWHDTPTGYSFDMSSITSADSNDRLLDVPSDFIVTSDHATVRITGLDGDAGGDVGRNLFGHAAASHNSKISGFKFVGENGVGSVGFVYVDNNQSSAINYYQDNQSGGFTVENCEFHNLFGFPVHAGGFLEFATLHNLQAYYCANGINVNGQGIAHSDIFIFKTEGFETVGPDCTFDHCTIIEGFNCGFALGNPALNADEFYHGCSITNCTVSGMTDPDGGQAPAVVIGSNTRNCRVSDLYARACTGAGLTALGEGTEVLGCTFINNSNDTSTAYQVGLSANGCRAIGNKVKKTTVQAGGTRAYQSLSYWGFEYLNGAQLGAQVGIYVAAADCEVCDNDITAANYGIQVHQGATALLLGANRFDGCTTNIYWSAVPSTGQITAHQHNAPTTDVLKERGRVAAETFNRWGRYGDGTLRLGGGAADFDASIGRLSAGQWRMGGSLFTEAYGSSGTPSTKACVQSDSTTQGWLPPRMTTTDRDNITSPPAGLLIFNTTATKLQCWDGALWRDCW